MNNEKKLGLLLALLVLGWTGNAEALNIGQVGQSVNAYGYGIGSDARTGGTITASVAGTYTDPWAYLPNSWGIYDSRARASAGNVGTYMAFSYSNGGDWYGSRATAESGDIFTIYDPLHANGLVDITFGAYIHGGISSAGSDVQGNTSATLQFGEYDPTRSFLTATPSNQLFYDFTRDGATANGLRTLSYTYSVTLDGAGYGQLAALLTLDTYASEGASKWTPSAGDVTADYYNTVSMTVAPQSGSTSISSQGGWQVAGAANANPVPEPSTLLILGSGIAGLAATRRYLRR